MSNVAFCQACRRQAAVKYCEFTQGIGMLVLRTRRGVKGPMCRDCASKHFWKLTGLTLLTGWWGMISFVMNIVYIISNISYFVSSRALPSPSGRAFPVQPTAGGQTPGVQRQSAAAGLPVTVAMPPPVATTTHPLAGRRQDIVLRLRGGQTPEQVAQYTSAQTGIPATEAQRYVQAVADGRA